MNLLLKVFILAKNKYNDIAAPINEYFERYLPGEFKQSPKHELSITQVYQMGSNFKLALEKATFNKFKDLSSCSNTLVASIGTCFAEEFSAFMKNNNGDLGKYLFLEDNVFNSSANWGRVYTIQNLLQIVKYSLSDKIPIYLVESSKGFLDPLREYSVGYYQTSAQAQEGIINHRKFSKEVFLTAKILVITLGQNEAWFDIDKNIYWGAAPDLELRKQFKDSFKPTETAFSQNLKDLELILDLLFEFNSDLKIIITVSPVAAGATFLSSDVITQSFAGKCIIRSVVHEVMKKREGKVFYFPSFEMVLCDNPKSFRPDNRHVNRRKVDEIFSILGNSLK